MKKSDEAFNHVTQKLHQAQLAGQEELILHAGTLLEELGWKQLQRVASGTLVRICAQFHAAGREYSYQPVSFPTFRDKAENIYGSNLRICFRFPSEKDILPILKRFPGDTAYATVEEELQNKRILHELEHQPLGSHKWHMASEAAKNRGLLMPE